MTSYITNCPICGNEVQDEQNWIRNFGCCKKCSKEVAAQRNAISMSDISNSGIVVIDTETTGLDEKTDEILQISIIDGTGKELLNCYCCPVKRKRWPDSAKVHGITYDMVKDFEPALSYVNLIQSIIDRAKLILIYNAKFDMKFLRAIGVRFDESKICDVMKAYSFAYGQYNSYRNSYTYKKLSTAAASVGYKYRAHDSLEDVKATLYVYYSMCSPEEVKKTNTINSYNWTSYDSISQNSYTPYNSATYNSPYQGSYTPYNSVRYDTNITSRRQKNKWISLLLCIFTICGHKFYEGKIGMGILYLCTIGLFGVGWIVDIIRLACKPNPYYIE
jgi:DNA polymerase-3 subunit epsilon